MSKQKENNFNFKATGIGSVPSVDIDKTCLRILDSVNVIPFWPQFVNRSYAEDMSIQYSEGLPLLRINKEGRSLSISTEAMEAGLVEFYDNYLNENTGYFAISPEFAPGLYRIIELIQDNPDKYGPFIKGHTVGPVTFAAVIMGPDKKPVLSNPDLLEALTKGLAIKALWQANTLKKTGKRPIIFLDEPYLSGFGSAFSPIERTEVIDLLKEVIDYVHERTDALIGIHCCGNTDWSMIMETGTDIINFDAFAYMDYFLLYPDEIKRFIENNGVIAWGIVPTADFSGNETVDMLYTLLQTGLKRLSEIGLDAGIIAKNSLLTPACGMGTMVQSSSDMVLDLLSKLSIMITQ